MREFLLELWGLLPVGWVWDVRRWDGAYFHRELLGWDSQWRGGAAIGIWEERAPVVGEDGQGAAGIASPPEPRIVAVVHPEGPGQAWLHVRPEYHELEAAMLDWAEANLVAPNTDGTLQLKALAQADDAVRQDLLARRGYALTTRGEHLRRFTGAVPTAPVALPAGYRLHTVRPGHPGDCARYADLLNAAFRRSIHSAEEVATFTTLSPSFNAGLELAAVAPDGSFAALAGMIHDAQNGYALFEPVCATPAPRPLGLTGLLMHEGVRRATALGAREVYVGSGCGMPANRFYDAAGFKIVASTQVWVKLP